MLCFDVGEFALVVVVNSVDCSVSLWGVFVLFGFGLLIAGITGWAVWWFPAYCCLDCFWLFAGFPGVLRFTVWCGFCLLCALVLRF